MLLCSPMTIFNLTPFQHFVLGRPYLKMLSICTILQHQHDNEIETARTKLTFQISSYHTLRKILQFQNAVRFSVHLLFVRPSELV